MSENQDRHLDTCDCPACRSPFVVRRHDLRADQLGRLGPGSVHPVDPAMTIGTKPPSAVVLKGGRAC